MTRKKVVLLPNTEKLLINLGSRIKKARLRRNIQAELLAKRASISKGTLTSIEKGVPTVSIGAYVAVLYELELEHDLELIAVDEEGKKQFWKHNIQRRERATRKTEIKS